MSSQSGISISDDAAARFPEFAEGSAQAAILTLNNDKECVELDKVVEGTIKDVQRALGDGRSPRYIALRSPESDRELVFVQYMPDTAPLSQKMKYASSHATVKRQLGGSARFKTTVLWTELEEVSSEGLKAHFAHENAPAPKTQEEQSLASAAELESATNVSRSAATGRSALSVNADVSKEAETAISNLQPNKALLFVVKSLDGRETIELEGECSCDELSTRAAGSKTPLYVLADVNGDAPVFAFVCPPGSSIKQRMVFASARLPFHGWISKRRTLSANIESYEPEQELTLAALRAAAAGPSSAPAAAEKPRFRRPKPPRR